MGNYLISLWGGERTLNTETLVNLSSLRREVGKIRKFSPSEYEGRVK